MTQIWTHKVLDLNPKLRGKRIGMGACIHIGVDTGMGKGKNWATRMGWGIKYSWQSEKLLFFVQTLMGFSQFKLRNQRLFKEFPGIGSHGSLTVQLMLLPSLLNRGCAWKNGWINRQPLFSQFLEMAGSLSLLSNLFSIGVSVYRWPLFCVFCILFLSFLSTVFFPFLCLLALMKFLSRPKKKLVFFFLIR